MPKLIKPKANNLIENHCGLKSDITSPIVDVSLNDSSQPLEQNMFNLQAPSTRQLEDHTLAKVNLNKAGSVGSNFVIMKT